jgi:hypothetical protein
MAFCAKDTNKYIHFHIYTFVKHLFKNIMKVSAAFRKSLGIVLILFGSSGHECRAFSVPSNTLRSLNSFQSKYHLISSSITTTFTPSTIVLGSVPAMSSLVHLPTAKTIAATTILPTSIGLYKYEYAVSYAYGTVSSLYTKKQINIFTHIR